MVFEQAPFQLIFELVDVINMSVCLSLSFSRVRSLSLFHFLSLSMCGSVCVSMCVALCAYVRIYVNICVLTCMRVCVRVRVSVCMRVWLPR